MRPFWPRLGRHDSDDESTVEGSLYRLDPGPDVHLVLDGIGVSKGLGWSPDARTM